MGLLYALQFLIYSIFVLVFIMTALRRTAKYRERRFKDVGESCMVGKKKRAEIFWSLLCSLYRETATIHLSLQLCMLQ